MTVCVQHSMDAMQHACLVARDALRKPIANVPSDGEGGHPGAHFAFDPDKNLPNYSI